MIESDEFEQEFRPSAFAIAIIFGGTVGLTISQMMGFSGNIGFLAGFFFLFIVLVIAILKARSDKRDELITELENEVLALRKKIVNSFIEFPTDKADSNRNEPAEDKREHGELKEAIGRLRKSKFMSSGISSPGRSEEIKLFKSEVDAVADTIKKLEKQEKYKTHLKAIEILKQEIEAAIRFLDDNGGGK